MSLKNNSDSQAETENQVTRESGASLVEYALLLSLIMVIAIAAIKSFGNRASQQFSATSSIIAVTM